MELIKLLAACVRFFLPPKPGESEQTWRYKVASTLGALVALFILAVALSLGKIPSITLGFASVDDENRQHAEINKRIDQENETVTAIRDGLSEMRRDQLDTRLYDTRGRQCAAIVTKNDDALRSEGKRLLEDLPKYHDLAGEDWRIPPCDEY